MIKLGKYGKINKLIFFLSLVVMSSSACSVKGNDSGKIQDGLFADYISKEETDHPSYIEKSRLVKVNTILMVDGQGKPIKMESGAEINLNLFPEVNFTGVIERIEKNSETSFSWIGYIKDVESGYFYLVISEGIFIAHVATPEAIYEVHNIRNDIYEIIRIDQSVFRD